MYGLCAIWRNRETLCTNDYEFIYLSSYIYNHVVMIMFTAKLAYYFSVSAQLCICKHIYGIGSELIPAIAYGLCAIWRKPRYTLYQWLSIHIYIYIYIQLHLKSRSHDNVYCFTGILFWCLGQLCIRKHIYGIEISKTQGYSFHLHVIKNRIIKRLLKSMIVNY